jgi:hypothetical protein
VKALRRPTVAAWGVNQAARDEPGLVEELLAAGERLADAQRRAVSGEGGADELRDAGAHRRDVIGRLTDAAVVALARTGRSGDTIRDDIAGTFEAATVDREVAVRVRAGMLDRTVAPPSGLGGIEGFRVLEGGGGSPAKAARTASTDRRDAQRLVREAERADGAAAEASERSVAARAAADQAARRAEELEAAAREAERDAKRLVSEAKTARARAERAVRHLER